MSVKRVYVEKKPEFAVKAGELREEISSYLSIDTVTGVRVLIRYDIENLSEQERRIALNEIYARHGRKFKDEELQAHFDSCSWYKGTIEPEKFNESDLSEVEIANRDLLVQYRKDHGEN